MSAAGRGRLLRGKQLFLFQSCLFKAVFRLILWELHTYSPPVFSQIHLYLPTHSIFLPLVSFLFKPRVQSVLPSPLGRRAICCSVVDWPEVPSLMETASPFPRSYYQWCLSQGWDFMSTSEGESWWVTEKTGRFIQLTETHLCPHTHAAHMPHTVSSPFWTVHLQNWTGCHYYVSQEGPISFPTCHFGGGFGVSFLSSLSYLPHIVRETETGEDLTVLTWEKENIREESPAWCLGWSLAGCWVSLGVPQENTA